LTALSQRCNQYFEKQESLGGEGAFSTGLEGDVDSQPLMGLNDLTHESILSSTWLSSVASSQMRGTRKNTQLDNVLILITYEHYDLLLRMIDKASQIEGAKRDLPHVLELLAIRTYYLPCHQWKVESTKV
jgi:hypothetical protein